jgi:hypothetical protein
MVEYDHFGGGSVMVWGISDGISIGGRTELYVFPRDGINAQCYLNDIIIPIVVPYTGAVGERFVLLDDNTRQHRARIVENVLEEQGIERMD